TAWGCCTRRSCSCAARRVSGRWRARGPRWSPAAVSPPAAPCCCAPPPDRPEHDGLTMTLSDSDLTGTEIPGTAPSGTGTAGPAARRADAPVPVLAEVDGVPVSGLLAEVPDPRAVLVALHGGATSAAYFDCPGHPELSLLRTAARLGFTVLALDRPGYGASAPFAEQIAQAERRIELVYAAIEEHLGDR